MENNYFDAATIKSYLKQYSVTLCNTLATIPSEQLDAAVKLLRNARCVYVAGNGGSASAADHWTCDHLKGRWSIGSKTPQVHSLTAHTGLLTALANDVSYDQVFSKQLEFRHADFLDCVVLISASGQSANIVTAAQYCLDRAIPVIGCTGFAGGRLKEMCTVSLHVPYANYGLVEDAHQVLMHSFAQWLRP